MRPLFLVIFSSLALTLYISPEVSAQHHGAPPPAANIGDRKISLDFESQPSPIITGEDVEVKISFVDENAKKNVNHVTLRMDISKDGKRVLSEFFHSHEGEINLWFRDTGGGSIFSQLYSWCYLRCVDQRMDCRSWKSDNIKGRRDFLPTRYI